MPYRGKKLKRAFSILTAITNTYDFPDGNELYFKFCFDLLWKEVFGIPGSDIVRDRIRSSFVKHWGGAATADKRAGYEWAPYYKCLRYRLMEEPALWSESPFVARHMDWHSQRSPAHQWGKASTLIKWLVEWPVYPGSGCTDLASRGSEKDCLPDGIFSRETIDDFVFLTEASLEPAAYGAGKAVGNDSHGFLDYALQHFKQPRIFLLNPTDKEELQKRLRETYRPQCMVRNEWVVSGENKKKYPLSLWRHSSGSWIVFAHTNLTGQAVTNGQMAEIVRLIRKAARHL